MQKRHVRTMVAAPVSACGLAMGTNHFQCLQKACVSASTEVVSETFPLKTLSCKRSLIAVIVTGYNVQF